MMPKGSTVEAGLGLVFVILVPHMYIIFVAFFQRRQLVVSMGIKMMMCRVVSFLVAFRFAIVA
jgi:hypothetical protein